MPVLIVQLLWLNVAMFKPLPLYIGARYTRARRRNQFLSFISWLSLLGMMLGVAVVITVISVMNGFENEIRGRILDALPHAYVESEGEQGIGNAEELSLQLQNLPGVVGIAPYIGGQGMASVPGAVRGAMITGIDPQLETQVSNLSKHMRKGSLQALNEQRFGLVLGSISAAHLQVGIGDYVAITLPKVAITPLGVFPRVKRFKVVGIFELGAQTDGDTVYINLRDAKKLFRLPDAVGGLRIKLQDLFAAPDFAKTLKQQLGEGYAVKDWSTTQGGLFQAIAMEKAVVGLMLMIVVAVAAFNIVSILVMMVTDKRADVAVLRTMGMSKGQVMAVFMTQGILIGCIGIIIGVLLGSVLALNIGAIVAWLEQLLGMQMFDPSVYFISNMPSLLRLQDVVVIASASFILCVMASIYPAWRAASISAAEVLRYE